MSIKCRLCGSPISSSPLLELNNMPKSAQSFVKEDELDSEKGVDIILYQCENCGLVQATGEPVPYYKDVIRATSVSGEMRSFRLEQFGSFIENFDLHGKRILEVGAGTGDYLSIMSEINPETYGLEHNEESVQVAEIKGLKMIQGFIENENYRVSGDLFDGFFIMNYLEHIPEPVQFLKGISNNLSENGVGIIEVPNFDMMIRENLFTEFIQDHLSYFTKDSLQELIEISGFELLEINNIWHDYIISAVVRKRSRIDVAKMKMQREKNYEEIQSFISQCKNRNQRIAVWGAGHQALATISLLEIYKHIEVVFDSAEFKQNLYTPCTHIKVVSPKLMKKYSIDVVIIIAGSYSEEIGRIMDREYPNVEWVILGSEGLRGKCCE